MNNKVTSETPQPNSKIQIKLDEEVGMPIKAAIAADSFVSSFCGFV